MSQKRAITVIEAIARSLTLILICLLMSFSTIVNANELKKFDTPEQERLYQKMTDELRCPKCQNSNLAGSDAPIAQDIKNKIASMIEQNKSEQEIKSYLIDRYGAFIDYKPAFNKTTLVLWLLPAFIFVVVMVGWLLLFRKKQLSHSTGLSADEAERVKKLLTTYSNVSARNEHEQ